MFLNAGEIDIMPAGKSHVKVRMADGSEIPKARLKRLFPLTKADSFIRMVTPEGKEAGIIKSLHELKPESRKTALQALNHFYIIPKITEILSLYDAHGSLFWEVMTDKGARSFTVKNRYRDISILASGKMIIRDTDDNQYEITDYNSMPPRSRKLLEPWL